MTGNHSSPVRAATGTVAERAKEHEDADRRDHACGVGLPAQRQNAEEEPDGHGNDLSRPPARNPTASLAWTEAIALTRFPAHAPSSGRLPGGPGRRERL